MHAGDKEGLIFQTSEGTPLNPSNVFNRMFKPAVIGHKDAAITYKVYSYLITESRPEAAAKTDAMLLQSTTATQTAQVVSAGVHSVVSAVLAGSHFAGPVFSLSC
jgi:hypothetical protein